MTARRTSSALLLSVLLFAFAAPRALAQCVSLTTLGSASTQSFNTLSNTAGSTTNNLTITGWFMTETGGGARDNEQYAVDTGGSNTGDTYSYGPAGNTDRALGGLQSGTLIPVIGACFTNNTGSTVSSLDIAYTGEQWRIGNTAAARDDRLDFQYSLDATSLTTGAWTNFDTLDFTNPIKTNATQSALDGNAAANRTTISQTIPALSIANGATFWIRWNDLNASGSDDGLAVDDFSLTPQGGAVTPTLNIGDVTLAEGDAGTTTFTFAVTLTAPAGPGGVTFDIATADGTAQDDVPNTEDEDYIARSLTGQTIPMGSTGPFNFAVTVNGDTEVEPNETFFVNVTNIVGANAGDTQGLGTINNDDVTITPIHDVQGPGSSSPIVGATVTIRGIVTGVKSNGFFVQEEEADYDADPATSEGIFVFTSSAPPAAAAFTALVQVTGTVLEFVPSQDPQQPPLTELGSSPTTVQLGPPGQPLPAAVPLTPTFPDPAGPFDQLERVEGMRVSATSMTVVAPSDGSINEPNNTGTSNGRFFAVVAGVPRPFREPGIRHPDVPPVGSIPPIPRWDTNPELLGVESAAINSQPVLTVKTSDTVAPIVGPLDYGFRRYAVYPDGTNPIAVTPGTLPTTVTTPTAQEFTVASWNIFHLYDTANDPATSDAVLTPAAYADRLNKASIAIRNHLKFPDVVGLQEVEHLTVLQDLATKINNDAVANAQPNPMYVAFLSEGNDVGGIDVGFLVKTAPVAGGQPRVAVNSVTQIGASTTWTDPDDGASELLNDRPSLVLDAVVHRGPGASFPVIVINNHLRSLIGIDSNAAAGATTTGDRVRRKRQTQADFLAQHIQSRLTTNPNEHIVLVGDFNAFEFNDGYADVINTIEGTPPPDAETVVCGTCPTPPNTNDGVDQVNPDLTNLVNTPPPSERYSYVFDGNAQNLDHAIVSAGLVADTTARRIEHPRIGADYPETERSNAATAIRTSDHDPVVAFFAAGALALADLSVTKADNVDPINAGQNYFYTITVTNAGTDAADNVSWSDTLPVGTTFVSLAQPGGWSCTTPAVGAHGTVTCSIASLGVTSAAFTLTVASSAALASGSTLSNTVTVTSATGDPDNTNNSATQTTTVATSADLLLSKTDSPDPVTAGGNLSYQITLTNNGPSNAAGASFSDTLPAGTTFVSLSTTGPWTCTTPAVGATGTVTCTNASFLVTVDFFTIVVNVGSGVAGGTTLSNTATLSSSTPDPNGANNSDTATTTVATSADLLVTKTDSPDPVTAGTDITYAITVSNVGPSDAAAVSLTDTLPAGTTFVSLSSPGGWSCTTPAVGATGAINCSIATFPAGGVSFFSLVVNTSEALANGTIISNTANVTSTTTDPSPGNNAATATTTVGTGSADLSISKTDTPTDPVNAGDNVTYTIALQNNGPSAAGSVTMADTLPAGTTFVSLTAPAGWTCTTPPAGGTGTVSCSIPTLGVTSAVFSLVMNVDPSLTAGLSNTATVTSATTDPNAGNNSATETTTVNTSADVHVTKTDTPDPVTAGTNITYAITVTNAGPSDASTVSLADNVPAGTTFVSLTAPGGWTCSTPAAGGTGAINCSIAALAAGSVANFTLVVAADPALTNGTVITNTATVASTTSDPNSANNTDTAATTVGVGSADLSVTKTDSPDPVNAGSNITYTITVNNAGPTNAASVTLSDTLPASTTFVSLTAAAGWTCVTPAAGAAGTVTCTNPSVAPGSAVFTLVVNVAAGTPSSTVISNTATVSSTTADPATGNESDTETTAVVSAANVTGTKTATGTFLPGGSITYTIVLTNSGPSTQQDNPGPELVDVLPSQLTLVSATATSGTATPTVATNTVTWNGSIAPSASVTITINATINAGVPPGTTVTNQGTIHYDADGNGTNEASRPTDNPAAPGGSDATAVVVAPASHAAIPTLDEWALMGLAVMLGMIALLVMKK